MDIVGPYVRHLVTRHRALLTEEDGVALAFGAVVDAGLAIHLADLFVVPDRLGQASAARCSPPCSETRPVARPSRPTTRGRCRSTCGQA